MFWTVVETHAECHILSFSLSRNDLISLCDWTIAQFTSWLSGVTYHPLLLSPSEIKIPFSHTTMERCAELGDISTLEEGSADMLMPPF